jgi:RimJ/RimL family protein N-acetyltransferase
MRSQDSHDPISPRYTRRLVLRKPQRSDLEFVIALFGMPELVAHRPNPVPDSAEASTARLAKDMGHWERRGFGRWAIVHDGTLIGFGGVTTSDQFDGLNLSYHLQPSAWGQGFASEVVAEAVSVAFDRLKAQRVIGLVRPANPASGRVLERAGFLPEAEVELHGAPTVLWARYRS